MDDIHIYLRDLEDRIDPASEERLMAQWRRFADLDWRAPYFKPRRQAPRPSSLEWPSIRYNDAVKSHDGLVYKELLRMNSQLAVAGPELLSYRASYGTVILPTLFGAVPLLMSDDQDSLPCSKPLDNAEATFRKLLSDGRKINVRGDYSSKTFEAAAHFRSLLKEYPKLSRHAYIYVPDTEGPISIMEALFGSEFYFLFEDEPALIHDSLALIAETFIDFVNAWHAEFPPLDDTHRMNWGMVHRGRALIREDAATNISGDTYREFIFPHDKRIMEALGGGAIHFCGKGDHLIGHFADLPGFYALNMSQPDWNDMEVIYNHTIRKGTVIIGLAKFEVNRCLREGIDLLGRVEAGLGIPAWLPETEEVPDIDEAS